MFDTGEAPDLIQDHLGDTIEITSDNLGDDIPFSEKKMGLFDMGRGIQFLDYLFLHLGFRADEYEPYYQGTTNRLYCSSLVLIILQGTIKPVI
jgi:hypothetical protein